MHKRTSQLNNRGIGMLDAFVGVAAFTGLLYATAMAFGTNAAVRSQVRGAQSIENLTTSFAGLSTQLHAYLSELREQHNCNQSGKPFQSVFSQVTLGDGSRLKLYVPPTQDAHAYCGLQTWIDNQDLTSIKKLDFCMEVVGPSNGPIFINFEFTIWDGTVNRELTCGEVDQLSTELGQLQLHHGIHYLDRRGEPITKQGIIKSPIVPREVTRAFESNFGLADVATQTFYLDKDGNGVLDTSLQIEGLEGTRFIPVSGNWDGSANHSDGVGLYSSFERKFFLRDDLRSGTYQTEISYPAAQMSWAPITGKWSSGTKFGLGFFESATQTFYLDTLQSEVFDKTFTINDANFAVTTGHAFAGDWDGDGTMGVGMFDGVSKVCLVNSLENGSCDAIIVAVCTGNCHVFGGANSVESAADTVSAYAADSGTFFWLVKNLSRFTWDGNLTMGPKPSAWQPIQGFWNGRAN